MASRGNYITGLNADECDHGIMPGSSSDRDESIRKMEELGIMISKPKHPAFAMKLKRFESFANWPEHIQQRATAMSEAGFFYSGL